MPTLVYLIKALFQKSDLVLMKKASHAYNQ